MEHYKISKLLNDSAASKFVTKNGSKLLIYKVINTLLTEKLRFETLRLRSNLCQYNDAYIVAKQTIGLLVAAENKNVKAEKNVAFENNAPFRFIFFKNNSTLIDSLGDLDIVMKFISIKNLNLMMFSQEIVSRIKDGAYAINLDDKKVQYLLTEIQLYALTFLELNILVKKY